MSQLGPGAVCPRLPYLWMSVGDIKSEEACARIQTCCCCCCCRSTAHFLPSSLPLQPPQVLAWDSPPTAPLGLPVSPCSLPLLRGFLPPSLPPLLAPFVLTRTPHTQTETSSSQPHPPANPPKKPLHILRQ